MFRCVAAILTLSFVVGDQSFSPGCSFFNGQCVYNVKLGHERQCDVSTRTTNTNQHATTTNTSTPQTASSGTSDGFQACSCKDVANLNKNMDSLWKSFNRLQTEFRTEITILAQALNVSQDQLGHKDGQIGDLMSQNYNLTALLVNKDFLLNKSQVDLATTVQQMGAELTRLRQELAQSNKDLQMCRTMVNVLDSSPKPPVLYGDYVTRHFDFEDSGNSNFNLSSCWIQRSHHVCWSSGSGRVNTHSGPVEDHTFGAPQGHYMYIDPYDNAPYAGYKSIIANWANMTSPEFSPAKEYCVRFWYTLYGQDIGTLNVYAKVGTGNGYPVLTKTGQEDKYWHMAQISLTSEYTVSPFQLVFEASTGAYRDTNGYSEMHNGYGYIAVDDVYVYNTSCGSIQACPAGAYKKVNGNTTSCYTFHVSPASWYDAVKTCKFESLNSHLVGINSAEEQQLLVEIIKNDAGYTTAGMYGWYTSGNDESSEGNFVWTNTGYPDPVNYTNWHPGQPNNVGGVQNCLLMEYASDDFQWGDVKCDDKHPFICETHM